MTRHQQTHGAGVRFTREDDELVVRVLIAKRKAARRLAEAQEDIR